MDSQSGSTSSDTVLEPTTETTLSDDEQRYAQSLDPYVNVAKDYQAPTSRISSLLSLLCKQLQATDPIGFRIRQSVEVALKVTILNGFLAQHDFDSARRIHYARSAEFYIGMAVNKETLIRVISGLHQNGYIDNHTVKPGSHNDFRSSFSVSPRLAQLFSDYEIHPRMISTDSVVELRAPKRKVKRSKRGNVWRRGKLISTNGRKIRGLTSARSKLRRINKAYSNFVGLFVSDDQLAECPIDEEQIAFETAIGGISRRKGYYVGGRPNFRRSKLKRVFNNVDSDAPRLNQGGRFCGAWWQEIPGSFRHSNIWIGAEPAVELDFNSMEVALAYADKGFVLSEINSNVYSCSCGLERSKAKRCLLIALNCDNRPSAVGAISKYLKNTEPVDMHFDISQLLDEFEEVHNPHLGTLYGTERAMKRMLKESRITEDILLKAQNAGEVVLPVHDSYLIRESQESQLCAWMDESFEKFAKISCSGISLETPPSTLPLPHEVEREDYSIFFDLASEYGLEDRLLRYASGEPF